MKTTYRAALMVAAFVFLLPLSARSEIKAGSFEVSPFGGYYFFEDRQNLEDSFVYGGRIGYNFTKHFGIEGAVEFINSGVDDKSRTGPVQGQYRSPMDNVDLTFYHIDAVYHFIPDGRFNPFFVVGFGGTHYSPDISGGDDMGTFDFGVGAKFWLSDHIALRLDVRDNMVGEVFQETYHNISTTVGIVFAFGGKAKPAKAQVAKVEPTPEPKAAPKAEEKVIVLVPMAEPKVEETVKIIAAEPPVKEKVVILAFEDVHFDFDKSTLTKEAQANLKRSVQLLKDNPKAKIRIAGYTSAKGTKEYNQKLSERRAKAVYDYLKDEGLVPAEKLTRVGYGEARPAMYEPIPENIYSKEAKTNMRVLFEVIVQ
ncbi:MAG: outer membrane beta-barrel domain-containing protein [Deltaproteobacteria bacterium]|nr:outer membrane beta-barrel domain-containing protein [Deltaproteobacteria bacterium]